MIKAIVAMDDNFGIGKDGTLPWPHNKLDMLHFKENTTGHVVVMGSKTWADEKMPKPLPNRTNVVVTSNPDKLPDGADKYITKDIQNGILNLQNEYPNKDIWVIGGANLFKQTLSIIEELHLTRMIGDYDCDTLLSKSFLVDFELISESTYVDMSCSFQVWKRQHSPI
jgi:dihydrofolate reductase